MHFAGHRNPIPQPATIPLLQKSRVVVPLFGRFGTSSAGECHDLEKHCLSQGGQAVAHLNLSCRATPPTWMSF